MSDVRISKAVDVLDLLEELSNHRVGTEDAFIELKATKKLIFTRFSQQK
jgi:hypothetical protein